jgi:hypothetical protein
LELVKTDTCLSKFTGPEFRLRKEKAASEVESGVAARVGLIAERVELAFRVIGFAERDVDLSQRESGLDVDHTITAPLCESNSAIGGGMGIGWLLRGNERTGQEGMGQGSSPGCLVPLKNQRRSARKSLGDSGPPLVECDLRELEIAFR